MHSSGQLLHSVEDACTESEATRLLREMDALIARSDGAYVIGGQREASVHDIPGHSPREAAELYEPKGRIECTELPADVVDTLETVFARNLPALRYAYPEATRNNGWFYVEYGAEQFVNPHVDYHGRIGDPWPGVLATVSLSVCAADRGGEFFIETSGSDAVWEKPHVARRGLDWSTPAFREQRRVRWTARSEAGDMLVWGSQVIHGTEPVIEGRSCKFLTQLLS
jgi:hypothetical protein